MAMMTRPTSDYWDDLLLTSWEVRPQVIEAPQHRLLLSEEELFECVVRAAHASTPLRRFYLDGTVVHDSECGPLLPAATDRSLNGYYRRVEAQTGGAEWSLCLSRIHSVAHDAARAVMRRGEQRPLQGAAWGLRMSA